MDRFRSSNTKHIAEKKACSSIKNIDENLAVKRMKFVKRCKEQVNKRWTNEYIHALEERMKKQVQVTETLPAIGSIVLLKDDVKNKA